MLDAFWNYPVSSCWIFSHTNKVITVKVTFFSVIGSPNVNVCHHRFNVSQNLTVCGLMNNVNWPLLVSWNVEVNHPLDSLLNNSFRRSRLVAHRCVLVAGKFFWGSNVARTLLSVMSNLTIRSLGIVFSLQDFTRTCVNVNYSYGPSNVLSSTFNRWIVNRNCSFTPRCVERTSILICIFIVWSLIVS